MGLSGWNAHQKLSLTLDSSKVDEDLINFPVNITLSSGTGQTGFDATAVFDELSTVSGTKKIAITTTVSGVETELYTEIERWDWSNEEANLWIKVPTVSSGTNTELHLYYDSDHADNTDYIGDTGSTPAQNVWNSGFKAVYHMAQDPNGDVADSMKDSTSNTNHGTPAGTMLTEDLVNGKIGKAIDFDGSNDYINCANTLGTLLDTIYTVECIAKTDVINETNIFLGYRSSIDSNPILFQLDHNNADVRLLVRDDAGNIATASKASVLTITDHFYIVGVRNGSDVDVYVDASIGIADTDTFGAITENQFNIGAINAGAPVDLASVFNGIIDEIRISNTVRSAAWIKATYYSNWDDFVTFSESPIIFVFTNPIPAHLSTAYGTTEQVCLTTTISGEEPEYIYDASFYDEFDVQIGITVSGIQSGQPAESNAYLNTPIGVDYSWYMTATSSGGEDTSDTYTFHNRFLASGTTKINGTLASGIDVRLYLRDTGELIGNSISTTSGTFNIETPHNAESYCVALSPYTDTNSLIYDFLEPGD